jgi:hypothetical protein
VLEYTVLEYTVLEYTVLEYTVLEYTVLECTVLEYTVHGSRAPLGRWRISSLLKLIKSSVIRKPISIHWMIINFI